MEILVIFVVALLVFGPKKLPELGKSLGKGLSEFRRASAELRGSLEREMENIEHEVKAQEASKAIPSAPAPVATPVQTAEVHSATAARQYPGFVRADASEGGFVRADINEDGHPDVHDEHEYQR